METTLPPPLASTRRRRRRWPIAVLGLLVVILAVIFYASVKTAPYYELLPGQAQSVAGLITVPSGHGHRLSGDLLLTDVDVESMNYIQFLPAYFDHDATIVSADDLTADLPVSEYDAQGTVDMSESQLTAESVALRQLGYQVPETDAGVCIYVIEPGSPAWKALQVGDVISSIDGIATPNPSQLVSVLHGDFHPGQTVTLRVGSIMHPTPGHDVTLKLGSIREDGTVYPLIGIGDPSADIASMGTQPAYDMPLALSINSDNIGGPSAGLAFTLGIIDMLTGGHLTGGKIVAATGTIDPNGAVGDVGGVAQKTVAVERAGAKLFLVPPQELAAARSKQADGLEIEPVSTLSQALADLVKIGGKLGKAADGPPAGPGGHSVPYDWQDSPWS